MDAFGDLDSDLLLDLPRRMRRFRRSSHSRLVTHAFPPPGVVPTTNKQHVHVQADTEVVEAHDEPDGVSVKVRIASTGRTDIFIYDCVILCTGFDDKTIMESSMIGPELSRRLEKNQDPRAYALSWDGPSDRMIFVQSQNKDTHGLGDASFVTAAGRNASILNSMAGGEIYKIDEGDLMVALK